MRKGTGLALLLGLASATPLLVAFAVTGGAPFMLLVPLPLFLSGLWMGTGAAAVSAATACLALAVLIAAAATQVTGSLAFGLLDGLGMLVGTAVMIGGPVVFLVRQALLSRQTPDGRVEWYPPGLLVTWLTVIGLVLFVFSVLSILVFGGPGGIEAAFTSQLRDALGLMLPNVPEDELRRAAEAAARVGLGIGLDSWLMILAVNGILAQGVLARYGRALRPAPNITTLVLPTWIAPALAAAVLVALVAPGDLGFAARSVVLVLLLPYFFAGLAVVHAVARLRRSRAVMLAIFYAIVVLFTWPAAVVTGIGLIDQWFDLRRRLPAPAGEREEE